MMDGQMTRLATLTPDQEQAVKDLENELGNVYVLAYEEPLVPARLPDDQLVKLQSAEQRMPGVVLVAYRRTTH